MVEFQEPTLLAAVATGAEIDTAGMVPQPDGALDDGRDIGRARLAGTGAARSRRVGELLLGQILEQRGQRAVEGDRVISRRGGG
jgi:hypothetical protein